MKLLVIAFVAFASRPVAADPLVVGTHEFAPFVIHEADGNWTGISIELWKRVAQTMNVPFVIRDAPVSALLAPDANGIDVVVSLPISAHNAETMDLTHAFYSTGCSIATRAEPTNGFVSILSRLFSLTFLKWLASLTAAMCLVGVVVWLFARKTGDFSISHGVLWAFESLAGKADALTKQRGGRVLTLLWTFACILLVSFVTAELTTELTLSQLTTKVSGLDDLPKVKVGSVKDSLSARYLEQRHIKSRAYPDLPAALAALDRGELDAVVNEAPLLQYEINKSTSGNLVVLPGTFQNHGYGFGVRRSRRDLLPAIDAAILTIVESDSWSKLLSEYLGGSRD